MIEQLLQNQDKSYREFNAGLIPNISKEMMIGVRVPILRKLAKSLSKEEKEQFLCSLPHEYFEENMLHSILLSEITDTDSLLEKLESFLPYIDNWAVCDALVPKIWKRHYRELYCQIPKWLQNDHPYTIRFGYSMLMHFYLEEGFSTAHLEYLLTYEGDDYYVFMMMAWYLATALVKQYQSVYQFLEAKVLPVWVQNKAIQKAVESRRITAEQKEALKKLKRK